MDHLKTPVNYVIITDTSQVTTPCYTTDECCMTVRVIEDLHMDKFGEQRMNMYGTFPDHDVYVTGGRV